MMNNNINKTHNVLLYSILIICSIVALNAQNKSKDTLLVLHKPAKTEVKAKEPVKDKDAVKMASFSTSARFSNIARVPGRDVAGMLVIHMAGPKTILEQMKEEGAALHAMYEDPARKYNTETAVRIEIDNGINGIVVGFLMDGDEFKLSSGREFFSLKEAKKYVDTFLGQYRLKAGEHVPATPTTPIDPSAPKGISN